jgi:hypothetical protein
MALAGGRTRRCVILTEQSVDGGAQGGLGEVADDAVADAALAVDEERLGQARDAAVVAHDLRVPRAMG